MKERTELVEKKHSQISMRRQCILLGIARSTLAYEPVEESPGTLRIKRILDELYLKDPCLGNRKLAFLLGRDFGIRVDRKRVKRIRQEMGQETIWCKPRTSNAQSGHRKYPYLLRGMEIVKPNQVWCTDITYVPMARGSAYMCAVMDWYSRKVLGWAISNTMDTGLCLSALELALSSTGRTPEILNTDQGSHFTSQEWIEAVQSRGIKVSMDGKGRWMDNVMIERLWRSVKHEDIYLHERRTLHELDLGLDDWFERYNTWRPHQELGNLTPSVAYQEGYKAPQKGLKRKRKTVYHQQPEAA